ncbi:hypothetical protein JOD45_002902 [Scopulibacillus daqui]|uniref:Uncharacterized protein n=1 Tax=Scopulibacillus daqui TaxID=1469162 RepID=A0ABS2Q4P6_9BACL|nr:hypothetical protein [Scopulibacillus daqui]MBM7646669.1 hypothetical protein [Scopulibacillus daqui]
MAFRPADQLEEIKIPGTHWLDTWLNGAKRWAPPFLSSKQR